MVDEYQRVLALPIPEGQGKSVWRKPGGNHQNYLRDYRNILMTVNTDAIRGVPDNTGYSRDRWHLNWQRRPPSQIVWRPTGTGTYHCDQN